MRPRSGSGRQIIRKPLRTTERKEAVRVASSVFAAKG